MSPGILLSVNQFSPRQFDKLFIVISSNEVGVFNLELSYPSSSTLPGSSLRQDEVRMEDLLGAQYENKERLDMFEGQAAFNLNMLIHQINKSRSPPNFEINIGPLLTKCTEFYNS